MMSLIVSVLLFNLFTSTVLQAYIVNHGEGADSNTFNKKRAHVSKISCPGCGKDLEAIKTQYHLRRIKEKIQAALGIDSDGPFSNDTKLPGQLLSQIETLMTEKEAEKFPEKMMERQILLPEAGIMNGGTDKKVLHFKISLEPRTIGIALSHAELWLPDSMLQKSYQVALKVGLKKGYFEILKKSIAKENISTQQKPGGWSALSLTNEIKKYTKSKVQRILRPFGGHVMLELSYPRQNLLQEDKNCQPFFIVEVAELRRSRKRRGVDCYRGKKSVCCRDRLTVNFADIGLRDHIIQPKEFEAYHCVGKCGRFSRSSTTRVITVKSVVSSMQKKNQNVDHISFCCTAARASPQKLLYYNNDKTKIISRMVEGLVIEECDCL